MILVLFAMAVISSKSEIEVGVQMLSFFKAVSAIIRRFAITEPTDMLVTSEELG